MSCLSFNNLNILSDTPIFIINILNKISPFFLKIQLRELFLTRYFQKFISPKIFKYNRFYQWCNLCIEN